MSTHPSPANRQQTLGELAPQMMEYYRAARDPPSYPIQDARAALTPREPAPRAGARARQRAVGIGLAAPAVQRTGGCPDDQQYPFLRAGAAGRHRRRMRRQPHGPPAARARVRGQRDRCVGRSLCDADRRSAQGRQDRVRVVERRAASRRDHGPPRRAGDPDAARDGRLGMEHRGDRGSGNGQCVVHGRRAHGHLHRAHPEARPHRRRARAGLGARDQPRARESHGGAHVRGDSHECGRRAGRRAVRGFASAR